jgi:hypothetical protein
VTAGRTLLRIAAFAVLSAGFCLSGCSKVPHKPATPRRGISLGDETIPLGRLPRIAIPERYRIALRIDPSADRFSGHAEIEVKFLQPRRSLFLHGLGLNVSGVTVKLKSGQSFAAHYDEVDTAADLRGSGAARQCDADL